jgi:uncharacterized protein (DUF2147 family)
MRKILIAAALMALAAAAFAADDVTGVWKSIDDKTGEPETITSLYMYQGKLYGRILITFEDGKVKDTIYKQSTRTEKYKGEPPYCGFDLVWALEDKGKQWSGSIFHPKEGNEYVCKVWKEGDALIVRGQIKFLGIGRNQKWVRATASDFPAGFQPPDPKTFVPVEPKKK